MPYIPLKPVTGRSVPSMPEDDWLELLAALQGYMTYLNTKTVPVVLVCGHRRPHLRQVMREEIAILIDYAHAAQRALDAS